MPELTPADLRTDKHGYVLFDCPDCPRTNKLKLQVIETTFRPEIGLGLLADRQRPNDCKRGPECGFRIKP